GPEAAGGGRIVWGPCAHLPVSSRAVTPAPPDDLDSPGRRGPCLLGIDGVRLRPAATAGGERLRGPQRPVPGSAPSAYRPHHHGGLARGTHRRSALPAHGPISSAARSPAARLGA